jgi:hypothetical protein
MLTTEFEDHIDVHEFGPLGAPILMKREAIRTQESDRDMAQADASRLGASMVAKDVVQAEARSAFYFQPKTPYGEIAVNPQPVPPREVGPPACNPLFVKRIDLPGIKSFVAVPGFADAPIALAAMVDGSTLVLDLGEDGTARVAGTFTGPMAVLHVSDDWAYSAGRDRVSIYRVTRQ